MPLDWDLSVDQGDRINKKKKIVEAAYNNSSSLAFSIIEENAILVAEPAVVDLRFPFRGVTWILWPTVLRFERHCEVDLVRPSVVCTPEATESGKFERGSGVIGLDLFFLPMITFSVGSAGINGADCSSVADVSGRRLDAASTASRVDFEDLRQGLPRLRTILAAVSPVGGFDAEICGRMDTSFLFFLPLRSLLSFSSLLCDSWVTCAAASKMP